MDTDECQPLLIDILEFFEGLNMKVTQQVPLLLVERQALNEAMDGERHVTNIPSPSSIITLFSDLFKVLSFSW